MKEDEMKVGKTMITEKEKSFMALNAYEVLKKTLDEQNLTYEEDKEKLVLTSRVNFDLGGKERKILLWFGVIPDSMLVEVTSPIFFNLDGDNKYLMAVAIALLNYCLPVGDFDYDVRFGAMMFRIANSYADCLLDTGLVLDMIETTIGCVACNLDLLQRIELGDVDFKKFATSIYTGKKTSTIKETEEMRIHAKNVFDSLCHSLDCRGISYGKSSDGKAVKFLIEGDHFPIDITIRADEKRQELRLLSKLPTVVPEDKRMLEGPVAACIASHGLSDGNFDYEFASGSIFFKVSESFLGRDLGDAVVQYMVDLTHILVNVYNYKFYQFNKGEIGLEDMTHRT